MKEYEEIQRKAYKTEKMKLDLQTKKDESELAAKNAMEKLMAPSIVREGKAAMDRSNKPRQQKK